MTPELTALALAGLLQVGQYALFAIPANLELGTRYTASPRDLPSAQPLSRRTARLQRKLTNHSEALVLFTLAVAITVLSNQSSALTSACGWTYLAARVHYVPAYAFGLTPWRSAIWGVGFLATCVMIAATPT